MSFELLNQALAELETALKECNVKLIVGGGFGLFVLQSAFTHKEGIRTLIPQEAWCVPRTTADIDVILETSIVASLEQFQAIRNSLDQLGYRVISGVEYLHFEKFFSADERVEINFLTGPIEDPSLAEKIRITRPRVRPKGDVQLHAYLTNEAIALSDALQEVAEHSNLFLPASMTLLAMKLHAFKDRLVRNEHEKAGHHAMDVYRVICMMTEDQYAHARAYLSAHKEHEVVKSAADIVHTYFATADLPGITKIREHPLYRPEFQLDEMRGILAELFE